MDSLLRRSWFTLTAFAWLLSLPVAAEESGPARLVADLAPGIEAAPQSFSGFAQIETRAVFLRLDHENRPALWITDGTAEGTSALGVLCPSCESVSLLGSTGSIAFYQVSTPWEMRIWRTDGTPAGTFPVMAGRSGGPSSIQGNRVFFTACTDDLGCELWSSDGSVAATAPVGEIAPSPESASIRQVAAFGDQAYMIASINGGPTALWLAGPSSLKLLRETPRASYLTLAGGRAFFVAQDDGWEVWTSNGTPAGTRALTHFEPGNPFKYGAGMKVLDGRLYFTAVNHGQGAELWSIGARPEGLRRLTAFSDRWASFSTVVKVGDRVVFGVRHGQGPLPELWTSRGDFRSTEPLAGCRRGCPTVESELVGVGKDQLVFFGRNQVAEGIWRTDGTGAGTRLLQPTEKYHELSRSLAAGGRVLFEITNEYETGELWITDGTAAGTFLVTHGGSGWSHYYGWNGPLLAGAANGQLLFPGLIEDGYQVLWRSNGSSAGSRPLTDPWMGASSYPRQLTAFGDLLLNQVCTGTEWQLHAVRGTDIELLLSHPLGTCDVLVTPLITLTERAVFLLNDGQGGVSIWGTDGTTAGTTVLIPPGGGSFPLHLARLGDQVAIWVVVPDATGQGQFGSQLWLTDGAPAGTYKRLDLPTATEMFSLTASGERLFFFDSQLQGNKQYLRPWVSDGTPAGTAPLTEGLGTVFTGFTDAGGTVFFRFAPQGGEPAIWRSDGTPAGTVPAITSASGAVEAESFAFAQGRLYFAARRPDDPTKRLLPWVSDGTDGGTALLADVALSTASSPPRDHPPFTELDGRVYFAAVDAAHGDELWVTDSTTEGTSLVHDIIPGPLGSYPRSLETWGGRLYFSAGDKLLGRELWTSDGSAAGTRLLQDIVPGPSWSAPVDLTATDGSLYFSANDGVHGRELWEIPPLN